MIDKTDLYAYGKCEGLGDVHITCSGKLANS